MGENYINMMDQSLIVTLTLDDDTEQKCLALCRFDVEQQTYIAHLPLGPDGLQNPDGDVYFYQFREQDGQPVLESILSDDIYMQVSDAFDAWLDQMEAEEA